VRGSSLVPVMAILIILAFVGLAYYYWHGGGQSQRAVTGVVVDKYERAAGTEAGGRALQQGMRTITGQTYQQETFYIIRVRTGQGKEVEMEVSRDFYTGIEIGDKVRRDKPDSEPYKAGSDSNIYL
jgi:hypothetical protein